MNLNVGCGPCYMDGWLNIDISPSHKTDICGDLLTLDFNDVDCILSTHCFEHLLYYDDATKALSLFHKWLKPGGILRLAVPDLELAVKAYVSGSDLKFLYGNDFKGYYYKDTPGGRLNFFIKAWQHQHCYDFTTLKLLLEDAGFINIKKKQPNQSTIPGFNHDRFISESL